MSASGGIWLGVDLGTSAVKAVAVDESGAVLEVEQRTYPLTSPQPGWVEQCPEDWWTASRDALAAVAAKVGGDRVRGIGLSGQMHGMVAMDEDGRVLRDAILWNDNRNGAECDWIIERAGGLDALLAMTNNTVLPGFTAGKIVWFRDHEPELFARMRTVLNPKDYLRYRLTGDRITDVSDASGTGLLDVRTRAWSDELLRTIDLDPALLPDIVESSAISGTVGAEIAAELGIPDGTPVVGGGGDAVLQTTAMGIVSPGTVGVTLGTAGIVATAADRCPENSEGRVQVSCGNAPDRWHIMGVALTTGGALEWWREALAPLTGEKPEPAKLAELAERSEPGARGLRFLPYLVGERCPHVDPDARGAWVGLDLRHGIADMTRALIEGAVLNLRQVRDVITGLGIEADANRMSGGASMHPIWTQTLVDTFGTPFDTVTGGGQGAAFGAALLAGVGTGHWATLDDALAQVRVVDTIEPIADNVAVQQANYESYVEIYPATSALPQPRSASSVEATS